MDVLGYARLSKASEESTSIEKQAAIIREFCDRKGWRLLGIIEDPDVSATTSRLDRPGLAEVRRRIAAGEAAAVVVWRLDRVARNVVDYSKLTEEGTLIVSASEDIDATTPNGKMLAQLLQIVAEAESRNTSARVRATNRHLKNAGKWPGGSRPYGYRSVPHPSGHGRALEPDPAEAAIVRRIAKEVLDGRSLYGIAQRLNEEGVPAPKGAGWRTNTIRRILTGEAILGRVVQHGKAILDDAGVPVVFWPPLIDLETAERLRAILDRAPSTPAKPTRKRAARLLSGLLECPGCGSALVVRSMRYAKTGEMVAFYGCSNKTRALPCPGSVFVRADRLEAEVERRFLAAVGHLRTQKVVTRRRPVPGLAETEAAIRETALELAQPDADMPALVDRLQDLHARRERLSALTSEPAEEIIEGDTFAEEWAATDTDGRRALLSSAPLEIAVDHAKTKAWDPSRVSVQFTS